MTRGIELASGIAIEVEDLVKEHNPIHQQRYSSALFFMTRLRDRRAGLVLGTDSSGRGGGGGGDEDDDDGDDDDDDDDEAVEVDEGHALTLRGVSFSVARGEAFGIVGLPDSGIRALTRVVSGMMSPTSGRVAVAGRLAPSVEFANNVAVGELHPRQAAQMLALLSGVPRSDRAEMIEEALRWAFAPDGDRPAPTSPVRLVWRTAVACALDPSADVLIADTLPTFGVPEFRVRSAARLEAALARGATAIVACEDLDLIARTCERAIWIENGVVAHEGSAVDIVEAFREVQRRERMESDANLAGFNSSLAVLSGHTQRPDGAVTGSFDLADDVELQVRLETARPQVTVSCRVIARGQHLCAFTQEPVTLDEPGRYLASLVFPAASLAPGEYGLRFEASVGSKTVRTTVGRDPIASLSIEPVGMAQVAQDEEDPASAAEVKELEGVWSVASLS